MRLLRALAEAVPDQIFQPQCLAQRIYPMSGAPGGSAFPGWFTIPAEPVGAYTLYRKTTQEALLKTFYRCANWRLSFDCNATWFSWPGYDEESIIHQKRVTFLSQPFGPRAFMPDIHEQRLPHSIFPRIFGVEQTIGTFNWLGDDGIATLSFFASFQADLADGVEQGRFMTAEIPTNSTFNGSELYLTAFETFPIIPRIFLWNADYYLRPVFGIQLGSHTGVHGPVYGATWGTPIRGYEPGINSTTGQTIDVQGQFESPLVTATGMREHFPGEVSITVNRFAIVPTAADGFFEYRDENGENPVWNGTTGAKLIDPVPLSMD